MFDKVKELTQKQLEETKNVIEESGIKEKIKKTIAPVDEMAEAKEIWNTWFSELGTSWSDTLTQLQELSMETFESFTQGFSDAFANALVSGQNFGDAMRDVLKGMLKNVISTLTKMGLRYVIFEKLKTYITKVETAKRLVIEELGAAKSLAISVAKGLKSIIISAYTAAAAGFKSAMEALPWPWNMIAAAATAAFAVGAVMKFAGAFEKGTGLEGVKETGIAQVHKGEIILNKKESDQLRSTQNSNGTIGANNGGSIIINALNVMPYANIDEGLFDKPITWWEQLTKEKILPALNVLGDNGYSTSLAYKG